MNNFLSENLLRQVGDAATAGTGTTTGDEVDMAGYEGAVFFCEIGTANAGNFIKIQQDTVTGMASAADLEGSKLAASYDGEIVAVEVKRPTERFLRALVVRGASSTHGPVYCIRYGAAVKPVDNSVDHAIQSEIHASPAEGTA